MCISHYEGGTCGPIILHFDFVSLSLLESQSSPSYRPSPEVAQADCMYHLREFFFSNPSFSVISDTHIALGRSCLLAKTSTMASLSSSSLNIRSSSSLASRIRSRSLLSTTNIRPWRLKKNYICHCISK